MPPQLPHLRVGLRWRLPPRGRLEATPGTVWTERAAGQSERARGDVRPRDGAGLCSCRPLPGMMDASGHRVALTAPRGAGPAHLPERSPAQK